VIERKNDPDRHGTRETRRMLDDDELTLVTKKASTKRNGRRRTARRTINVDGRKNRRNLKSQRMVVMRVRTTVIPDHDLDFQLYRET
jgi:hypothetical protein